MKNEKLKYYIFILFIVLLFMSNGIFLNVISVYLLGEGFSPERSAAIISAPSLFALVVLPVMGYVTDRAKRLGSIFFLAVAVSSLSALLFCRSSDFWTLFILNGLAITSSDVLMNLGERICSQTPYEYGKVRSWGTVGFALGAQSAGLVYDLVSPQAVYIFVAGIMIAALMLYPIIGQDIRHIRAEKKEAFGLKVFKCVPFWVFLALCFLNRGMTFVSATYQPLLFTSFGLSVSSAETIIFLAVLAEVPMILISGKLTSRFSTRTVMLISCLGLSTIWFLLGTLQNVYLLACFAIIRNTFSVLFIVITLKVTLELFGVGGNLAMGLAATFRCLGCLLFQNVSGQILGNFDVQAIFILLAAVSLIEIPICLLYKPQHIEDVKL